MVNKIRQCLVSFDGEKRVYRKGEFVKGTVKLIVDETLLIRGVRVYLYGEALTKWDVLFDTHGHENVGKEKYIGHVMTLFGNKVNVNAPHVTLQKGTHSYRFSFRLPNEGLPSSYEGEYGAIRYWLKILVDKPTFTFNREWYRGFTVLDDINVNDAKYTGVVQAGKQKTVSKALGFGNAGSIVLNAKCDRKAYCPGEKIALNILAKNNTSKDMGRVKAKLVQFVTFKANDDSKTTVTDLVSIEGPIPLLKGQEKKWVNELLQIDAIPPTTTERSCYIITVTYYIKVFIEVPWGFDLDLILPIKIGTIPYKHTHRSLTAGASNSLEIDASTALTYTTCNKGVQRCSKTNGNFVIIGAGFTPMCTYVPDYKFQPETPQAILVKKSSKSTASSKVAVCTPTAIVSASAPPIESAAVAKQNNMDIVLPPSYEEAMEMDSKNAKPETTKVIEIHKSDEFLLLARFSDVHIQEFRSFIVENRSHLKRFDGEILAFSVQPLSTEDSWPPQTSLAIFIFSTAENASEWFKSSPIHAEAKWATSSEALIVAMNEVHNDSSRVYTLSCLKVKAGVKANDLRKLGKLIVSKTRPIRIINGGVLLSSTKPVEILQGDWIKHTQSLTLNQWPKIASYAEYARQYKLHENIANRIKEYYEISNHAVIQSEDVSQYQITEPQSENETSVTSEDGGEEDVTSEYDVTEDTNTVQDGDI